MKNRACYLPHVVSKLFPTFLSSKNSDVTALLDTLTTNQLKNLEKHKYSCSGVSLLEPLYKPWWEFAIGLCPIWIAPNLITLVGLILNCSGFLLMAVYSGLDGKGAAPSWVYFYAAGWRFNF